MSQLRPSDATLQGRAGCYIHAPFCTSVCPYCDFSVIIAEAPRRTAWVEGILREIELHDLSAFGEFDTVYLGGGSPSSLRPDQIERVLGAARDASPGSDTVAVTLEINPEDVSRTSVELWREAGVDVASLGVQSFDDEALRWLGRRHGSAAAVVAAATLRAGGFRSLSIDLIYGYPGHDAERWRRDLARAVEIGPDHLSCYQLTIHEHTLFGRRARRGEMTPAPHETQTDLFFLTHEVLRDAGYEAYEVSNFATTSDHRSRHNQKYWMHVPYLGLGPSAHSFDGTSRRWNHRKLRRWQRHVDEGRRPVEGEERLSRRQIALEAVMLGLRTTAGLDIDHVRSLCGIDLTPSNQRLIDVLVESGHLIANGRRLMPTLSGLAIADGLAARFQVS